MAWSRGKKILVGCLVTVALLVLVLVAAIVLFVSWLRTPGPEMEGRTLITSDTAFYFRLRLAEEDPAVRELVRLWARSQNRVDSSLELERLPPVMRSLVPFLNQLGQREVSDQELDKMLPMQLVMTAPRTAAGSPPLVFAFNAPGMGNAVRLADWILARVGSGDGDLVMRPHGDERLYRLGGDTPAWVCIAGTDILVATDPDTLGAAVDRLAPPPGQAAMPAAETPADLGDALRPLPDDALLQVAGVAGITAPLTDVILQRPAPGLAEVLRPRLEGARALSGWARLQGPDQITGRLLVTGAAPLPEESTAWTLQFLDGAVTLRVSDAGMNVSGQRVFDIDLTGVEALVRWGAARLRRPGTGGS